MSKPAPALDQSAILYMSLLALQFGLQPTLTRTFTPDGICRSTVILAQEAVKFVIALTMLHLSGGFASATAGWNVKTWLSVAFVPAALYAVQNIAALQAYQNLDALTFNVLNQTKTLAAALCCYLVIGKRQSKVQVASLFLLLTSALVMERIVPIKSVMRIFTTKNDDSEEDAANAQTESWDSNHLVYGVAPILLASFISGLTGALTQKNLQAQKASGSKVGTSGRNPYLFSMELCAASVLVLLTSLLFSSDGERIVSNGFWDKWTTATWIPILTQSVGGIIVGLVTKYAGSVRKGFALIFGMLLSGIVQALIQTDVGVSMEQVIGGALAAVSLWMHATNPYVAKEKRE